MSNEELARNNEQEIKDEDQDTEVNELNPFFNTIGFSVGSAFIDPLIIATLHGSYAPIRNMFIETGFEFGFLSIHDDVDSMYCLYPYLNVGYFLPLSDSLGAFASIGGGLIMSTYNFSFGKDAFNIFAMNITAGVNLFEMLNISYCLKTSFSGVSHKLAVGYVYRVGSREKGEGNSEQ